MRGKLVAAPTAMTADELVVEQIKERVRDLERVTSADVYAYAGPIADFTPDLFKGLVESVSRKRSTALLWLETNGGLVESTERIANVLRYHYRIVDFAVTTFAMSAGTILAMSGDSIVMDYSATLGPIDPQIRRAGSDRYVPALGYLEKYDELVRKSAEGRLTTAEATYLLQHFDPGELYQFEQARDLSIALLEEWLVKYKFKNWKVTENRGLKVTAQMKRDRAVEIAQMLNDTKVWHSHSRGISMEVLKRKLKLHIDALEDKPDVKNSVDNLVTLFQDYRRKLGHNTFAIAYSKGYHGHGH